MKNKVYQWLIAVSFGLSILSLVSTAEAYPVYPVHMQGHCRYIPGHWQYGYYVPGHRVCWGGYRVHCRWVYGYHHHPYQYCWRR